MPLPDDGIISDDLLDDWRREVIYETNRWERRRVRALIDQLMLARQERDAAVEDLRLVQKLLDTLTAPKVSPAAEQLDEDGSNEDVD